MVLRTCKTKLNHDLCIRALKAVRAAAIQGIFTHLKNIVKLLFGIRLCSELKKKFISETIQ